MKRAFTLIELLVVIAIIAILAAILFPVFAQAKEAAKKTQSLSNIKNLALANIMYQGDSDDRMPMTYTFPYKGPNPSACDFNFDWGAPNGFRAWTEFVFPYVKNAQAGGNFNQANASAAAASIFVDPVWNTSAPAKDSKNTPVPVADTAELYPYASYVPNSLLMPPATWLGCSWMGPNAATASETEVAKPAQTVLLSQSYGRGGEYNYGNQVGLFSQETPNGFDAGWSKKLPARKGMAYAFADGHAKFVSSTDAFYSADPAYAGNTSDAGGGGYLPEPFGAIAASFKTRPSATMAFGPRNGG